MCNDPSQNNPCLYDDIRNHYQSISSCDTRNLLDHRARVMGNRQDKLVALPHTSMQISDHNDYDDRHIRNH